ncbi:aromatic-ring-hydroxylating dioxygenase subunit beta [Sphingomonas baiyangensis]|uniref:Aromatic-ring-hydroxylating dioxygenase subunit beta n=2 Tax=Sphingomonas baiyangensis TaxID=2572576 RepID=A0A4U1L5C8_9SPHN|nr:aromatic-ring-hydroxylating dioxygenase subunit beta [Sphingomonas baiyangensis]
MAAPLTRADAEELLYREALYLDRRDWDAWLALYTEDCVFWMPAWRDETTPTADPDAELSLIYYRGRRNLEDRVWRVRSGQSVASTPLPRSVHAVTNVLIEHADAASADVAASFTVHRWDPRSERQHVFFGTYRHRLVRDGDEWRIAAKTITLMNDVIPTVVDFYSI